MKPAATNSDRPRYPQYQEYFAEDPARFLASAMDPVPIIRGITDLGRANAWLRVARDLGCEQRTVDAIERRRDFLVEDERR